MWLIADLWSVLILQGFLPEEAVQTFGSKLLPYEQNEIYQYARVYFVGSQAKKRGGLIGGGSQS